MFSSASEIAADCGDLRHHEPSRVGILVISAPSKLVYANREALSILAYPDSIEAFKNGQGWDGSPLQQTMSNLFSMKASPIELRSGRRRYWCAAFSLAPVALKPRQEEIALVSMERQSLRALLDPSRLVEKFRLTKREAEAVVLLAQGLTNKEIALRMRITPNTTKTFLKLVMLKLSVSTRSGLVGKVMTA
jgi:DNA-binding CsgD family transcriptional regulator